MYFGIPVLHVYSVQISGQSGPKVSFWSQFLSPSIIRNMHTPQH